MRFSPSTSRRLAAVPAGRFPRKGLSFVAPPAQQLRPISSYQTFSTSSKCHPPTSSSAFIDDHHATARWWALAVSGLAGVSLLSSSIATTHAEADDGRPKQAEPIDWNVVFNLNHKLEADDDDDEPDTANEDDEDSSQTGNDIPSYINEFARKDLGNALNRHAPLDTEAQNLLRTESQYPLLRAELTSAPHVPPPVNRNYPVHLVVDIMTVNKALRVSGSKTYEFWPFCYLDPTAGKIKAAVPGPFIRARVGDILQVNHTNKDESGMAHSVDFHAVCGPGGGAPTTFAEQDETRTGAYRLLRPGLFVYHCAAAPIPLHIHNGMFGLILVEPEEGLPPVDKEFYVMQHELYLNPLDNDPNATEYEHDYDAATREIPSHVVFNGRENSLVDKPLVVNQDERVRIYFGNAGPNLVSSFHIIGTIFDKVYREGDLVSHPAQYVQTTLVPSGGAAVMDLKLQVPGNFALVDHSINRIDKGAVGFLKVKGQPRPDIYDSAEPPAFCPGCKVHN